MTKEGLFLEERMKLMRRILGILSFVIAFMAFYRLFQGNHSQFIADVILSVTFMVSSILIEKKKYFNTVVRVSFFVSILSMFYFLINVENDPMRFIWVSTNIYLIFYIFNKKEGILWILFIGILLASIAIYDSNILHLNLIYFLIWILNMVLVLLVANLYSVKEDSANQKLFKRTQLLEREIRDKNEELKKINEELECSMLKHSTIAVKQEEVLQKQIKMLQMGEVIGMIVHQWRQPLSAISSTTTALKMRVKKDKYDKSFFDSRFKRIFTYVEHLSDTMDDFKGFFNEDKKETLFYFSDLLKDLFMLLDTGLKSHKIKIEKKEFADSEFLSYPNEIIQVMINIIKNAEDILISNKVSNPKIKIKSYFSDDNIIIEIADNGGGIDEGIIDKVFDAYFTTKSKLEGTGLGLYMSKVIIEEHCNGKLTVDNGKDGAIFRLIFKLGENNMVNKRITQTLKLAKEKFETFGFEEAQIEKLLESGKNDLIKELKKLKVLLDNDSLNMEEINKSIHGLKGLFLNLGNEKIADKLTAFRETSGNEEALTVLYKYLKLDKL